MILFLKYLWAVVVLLAVVMQGLTIVEADGLNHLMIHIAFLVGLFVCVIDAVGFIETHEPKFHFFLASTQKNGIPVSGCYYSKNKSISRHELLEISKKITGATSYVLAISYIGKMTKTEFLKDS